MVKLATWQKVTGYCVVTLLIASFYWVWAIVNTVRGNIGFDLGAVSFASAMLSSTIGLVSVYSSPATGLRGGHFWSLCIAHLFIVGNYVQGIVLGARGERGGHKYASYCAVAGSLWLLTGLLFAYLARRWWLEASVTALSSCLHTSLPVHSRASEAEVTKLSSSGSSPYRAGLLSVES